MDRVLVVEDERKAAEFIERGLALAGYAVDISGTGEEALEKLATADYTAVVLDLMLPGISGLDVVRELRRWRRDVPVLALTACGGLEERVDGLDAGCDDYLPKPFAFQELLARMRALQRRAGSASNCVLAYGELSLDLISRVAVRSGREVRLTNTEYALLESLMRFPEQAVSRQALQKRMWGALVESRSNLLDVYVNFLRRKIDGAGERKLLHTVRGIGYMLAEGKD